MCCGKFATTQYFLKKYCVVTNLPQHIIFSKNVVLRTWRTTQYFLKKECVVAEKNKVADTCHHIEGPLTPKPILVTSATPYTTLFLIVDAARI